MSEIRNYPSVNDFKQLADENSVVRFVSKNNEMFGTGKVGAFFSGQNARMAAMSDFISAVNREYGDEIGNLAANLLAAPKMQGRALTGSMVKDILAACSSEQSRIAEYNLKAAGQQAPEAVNQLLEEITAHRDLNESEKDTVQSFLEHNLGKAVSSLKDPVTADRLCKALREVTQQDLPELLAFIGKEEFPQSSDLASVKDTLSDLPPLIGYELGKQICSAQHVCLVANYAKTHVNDILNAAGPGGEITREAVWKGLSGTNELPPDMSLDKMGAYDFNKALVNTVISSKLFASPEFSGLTQEGKEKGVAAVDSALDRGLKFDVAVSCLKGQHTITLADFSKPLHVDVAHFTKSMQDAETGLVRDLSRRGGWAEGNANNRQFDSTINFEKKDGSTESISLTHPQKYILSDDDLENYKGLKKSSVSLQCCAQALQLCNGNELQAARLVGALGQQSIVWARFVSPILNVLTPKQVIGEHSPASIYAKRLENGDISVSMHTLDPNRTSYSISYLVKPDGSTPVTAIEIRPVSLRPQASPAPSE